MVENIMEKKGRKVLTSGLKNRKISSHWKGQSMNLWVDSSNCYRSTVQLCFAKIQSSQYHKYNVDTRQQQHTPEWAILWFCMLRIYLASRLHPNIEWCRDLLALLTAHLHCFDQVNLPSTSKPRYFTELFYEIDCPLIQ